MATVDPFAYDKYRKEQIQKKLKEKSEKRITVRKKEAKVNVDYVRELEKRQKEEGKNKKSAILAQNVLRDDRFK